MAGLNRATLIKVHLLLASFIFPVALMFLVTGGFYTWGIKGSYETVEHRLELSEPLREDAAQLRALVEQELQHRGLAPPTGEAKVKRGGTSFKFEWTGSDLDVVLEPTANALEARLQIKDTSWYRHFVQLHKAKGGTAFKVYAAILALSLLAILGSGFVVAWQIPKYRRLSLIFAGLGVLGFIFAYMLS